MTKGQEVPVYSQDDIGSVRSFMLREGANPPEWPIKLQKNIGAMEFFRALSSYQPGVVPDHIVVLDAYITLLMAVNNTGYHTMLHELATELFRLSQDMSPVEAYNHPNLEKIYKKHCLPDEDTP